MLTVRGRLVTCWGTGLRVILKRWQDTVIYRYKYSTDWCLQSGEDWWPDDGLDWGWYWNDDKILSSTGINTALTGAYSQGKTGDLLRDWTEGDTETMTRYCQLQVSIQHWLVLTVRGRLVTCWGTGLRVILKRWQDTVSYRYQYSTDWCLQSGEGWWPAEGLDWGWYWNDCKILSVTGINTALTGAYSQGKAGDLLRDWTEGDTETMTRYSQLQVSIQHWLVLTVSGMLVTCWGTGLRVILKQWQDTVSYRYQYSTDWCLQSGEGWWPAERLDWGWYWNDDKILSSTGINTALTGAYSQGKAGDLLNDWTEGDTETMTRYCQLQV